jgi:DNA-binding GntR family transcriptional regulator
MLYTIFTMADAATATPLTRRSAGDRIAAWIRGRIVTGQLRRGDRVTQEDVARDLGVSRIPVREALVALDREGWVTIEPHRGAFVAGVDEDWVRDHYGILGVLYGLAAGRAAARGTPAERGELRAYEQELVGTDDHEAFDRANHALLVHVLAMARAPRLVTALRAVTSVIPGNFFAEVPGAMEAQRARLHDCVDAIASGDADRARADMEALLEQQGAAVVAELRARGVLEARA